VKSVKILIILSVLLLLSLNKPLFSQISLDLESGIIYSGYNDVRIPGDTGDLFSLSEDLEAENPLFVRLSLSYTLNGRHTFSLLYAPLTVKSTGQFETETQFDDTLFPADIDIDASYTFNSYRFTYCYKLVRKENLEFGLGFTAKIRDAEIKLEADDLEEINDNVGFVPIVNFRFHYQLKNDLGFLIDGDALAAPQGRAEDILAAITYSFSEKITAKLGYRILEGGADNDEVYTFALFNYAVIGILVNI
jgi:hypothetical protein